MLAHAIRPAIEAEELDLERFHAGDREELTRVYRRYVARVERAVRRFCQGPEAENVVHDVFLRLVERREVRLGFRGGDLGAWLVTMASNRAIDLLRRGNRLRLCDDPAALETRYADVDVEQTLLDRDQAERLEQALEDFAAEVLPGLGAKLTPIFELRFRRRIDQQTAARALGLARTTLIDREAKLLKHLDRFLRRRFEGGCRR